MNRNRNRIVGFTLAELLTIIGIIAIIAALLFPMFARPHSHSHGSCASNQKQILLAVTGYTQDYDDQLPPVASPIALPNKTQALQLWGPDITPQAKGSAIIPGIISYYIKNSQVFRCPSVSEPESPLQYRMNDLAACANRTKMPNVSHTVLMMDGDDTLLNFGHSVAAPGEAPKATYAVSPEGKFTLLQGEAVSPETLIRHSGGCNYGFADGHVKWLKPEDAFFPPRSSRTVSHIDPQTKRVNGPDPGGDMTYQGKQYAATFHIR